MTRGARTLTSGTCIAVTAADGSAELGITRTARSIGGRSNWPALVPIHRGFTMTDKYPVDEPHQPAKGNPEWLHHELQQRELRRSEQVDRDRRQSGQGGSR